MKYKYLSLALGLLMLSACVGKRPLTQSLYQQSGRAHIYLPTDSEQKAGMLTERINIQTTIDTIKREATPMEDADAGKSITLETFTVTADRPLVKISTVRNGYVNLTFLMTLPKAFADERWQVLLSPRLINGSIETPMPPVVLQGKAFRAEQEKQYARLDALKQSVVDSAKYDSVFFDHAKHKAFITDLQRSYLADYRKTFARFLAFDRWRRIMQERKLFFDASYAGQYDQGVANQSLDVLAKAYDINLYGGDSTQLLRKHYAKYTQERRAEHLAHKYRPIRQEDVPYHYQRMYAERWTMDSLRNKSVTERDSLRVAQHTYDYKRIARNEGVRDNLGIYAQNIVKLPRIEGAHRVDSLRPGSDFVYLYSRDIEVKEGLSRRLRVVMDTRVSGLDESSWWQAGQDTLSFVVSGMNDLADKTLIDRLEGAKREEYQQGLDRLAAYDYRGALDILNHYPDFNSAVCLAALGHNEQAFKLLDMLQPANGRIDYLRAILYARTKQYDHARDYLLSSVRKEAQLAFKVDIEPEFVPVLELYPSLLDELHNIADGGEELI